MAWKRLQTADVENLQRQINIAICSDTSIRWRPKRRSTFAWNTGGFKWNLRALFGFKRLMSTILHRLNCHPLAPPGINIVGLAVTVSFDFLHGSLRETSSNIKSWGGQGAPKVQVMQDCVLQPQHCEDDCAGNYGESHGELIMLPAMSLCQRSKEICGLWEAELTLEPKLFRKGRWTGTGVVAGLDRFRGLADDGKDYRVYRVAQCFISMPKAACDVFDGEGVRGRESTAGVF